MRRRKVTSREYKVMLRPGKFAGDETALLKAAEAVWRDLIQSVGHLVLDTHGRLTRVHTRRLVNFHDTRQQHLHRASYIYRERRDMASGDCEATLKYRHPDRYVTEHRDMAPIGRKNARMKFEEDIKVPFVSLYSFSTTLSVDRLKALRTLGHAARLFPDLEQQVDGFRDDEALRVVNGFTAHERVIVGATLRIGKSPTVKAECALIVWHDHDRRTARPVAVELSYRYGDKDEHYGGMTARRAFHVFQALQTRLRAWIDPCPVTKTALVYTGHSSMARSRRCR